MTNKTLKISGMSCGHLFVPRRKVLNVSMALKAKFTSELIQRVVFEQGS